MSNDFIYTNDNSTNSNNRTFPLTTDSTRDMNNNYQLSSDKNHISSASSGYSTRSKRANLIFSVSRVEHQLRQGRYAERLNQTASVYLAGVLEYLVAETLEAAGEMTRQAKRKRIKPRDICLAVRNDDELDQLCSSVTFAEGGVVPHIHQILLTTKRRRRKRKVRFSQEVTYDSPSKANRSTDEDSMDMDTDGYLSSNSSDVDDTDLQME